VTVLPPTELPFSHGACYVSSISSYKHHWRHYVWP